MRLGRPGFVFYFCSRFSLPLAVPRNAPSHSLGAGFLQRGFGGLVLGPHSIAFIALLRLLPNPVNPPAAFGASRNFLRPS